MDSDDIRQDLLEHMATEKLLLKDIATEIGISYNTMMWFIHDEKETSMRTLLRIQRYLLDYKKISTDEGEN